MNSLIISYMDFVHVYPITPSPTSFQIHFPSHTFPTSCLFFFFLLPTKSSFCCSYIYGHEAVHWSMFSCYAKYVNSQCINLMLFKNIQICFKI